jgi:hypothetical protein
LHWRRRERALAYRVAASILAACAVESTNQIDAGAEIAVAVAV